MDLGFLPQTFPRAHVEKLRHVPLLTLGSAPDDEFALAAKRLADVFLSALALAVVTAALVVVTVVFGRRDAAAFERPVLRPWSHPPPVQESPVNVEVVWPADALAGKTATLRLMLRHSLYDAQEAHRTLPEKRTGTAPMIRDAPKVVRMRKAERRRRMRGNCPSTSSAVPSVSSA